ncbi:MAG: DEAD/DEAH box helicase [Flavobacteriales bacterium]|jgi:ATP-dependent RNA helicase RhlE
MQFKDLNLHPSILKAVEEEGYTTPTPIQEQAVPLVLMGRDVLGCAQTGTGKTAAFAMPILHQLEQRNLSGPRKISVLILTPTRELAIQIDDSFKTYGKYLKVRTLVIFGGVGQQPQVDALRRGTDVLIATPGRLLDLVNQRLLDLGHISLFVLDEADRMLDMGFIHDVRKVLQLLPNKRQNLFFSATMAPDIQHLADAILIRPVKVEVTPVSSTAEMIDQCVYFVDKANKNALFLSIVEGINAPSMLVFTRTKYGADRLARFLVKNGMKAEAIHGDKSQNNRQRSLKAFKDKTIRFLVATDIAARGIDIEEMEMVINYEIPNIPETYVHRIGRTGRAGRSGKAISLCDFEEKAYLKDIEKIIHQKVPVIDNHPYPMEIFEVIKKEKTPRPTSDRNKSIAPKQREGTALPSAKKGKSSWFRKRKA